MKRFGSILLSLCIIISILVIPTTVEATDSSVVEKAISWATKIANDNSHGYSQTYRWGNPDYDCSSFVISAFKNAGINTGATYTGNMRDLFTKNGFEWISWSKIGGVSNLKRGDILLNEVQHTELYLGNSQIIGAHHDYGYPQGGDQNGKEISVTGYYNHPWDGVLRYKAGSIPNPVCDCSTKYAGDYKVSSGDVSLNMRSGHGTGYSIITTIPNGSTVYVSKADGAWAHVKWNNYNGYCSMDYLDKITKINGYKITVSNKSFYDNRTTKITVTPVDSNITNYKLYFVAPNGKITSTNLGSKNYMYFSGKGKFGNWKVYAEITSKNGTYRGSVNSGYATFTVKKINWGKAVNLGKCFDATIGNACSSNLLTHNNTFSKYTNAYMSKKTNASNQKFTFVRQSDGSYIIKSCKDSRYCLDVYRNGYACETNIGVYPQNNTNSQKWMIYSAGKGYYYFRPVDHNSSVLDVYKGSSANGANVQLYTYHGENSQKFSINQVIKLSKTSVTLGEKESCQLIVTPTDIACTWSSDNTSVVSVDKNGKITSKKIGSAKITAKSPTGSKVVCKVTVKKSPNKVYLNKTSITLGVNEKFDLNHSFPSNTASYNTKYSSSNTSVATVDATSGVITAKKVGTAKITVKTHNGKTAFCTVTVKKAPNKITLNKTKVTLKVGKTVDLNHYLPSGTASYHINYLSSNTSIATVDSSGIVTAKKVGTTIITVQTYNGKTATCKVTVIK